MDDRHPEDRPQRSHHQNDHHHLAHQEKPPHEVEIEFEYLAES